jgi:hypothetical protein
MISYWFALMALCGLALPSLADTGSQEVALSVRERITGRTFPSVFQAWNRANNLPHEDLDTTLARHDLVFHSPLFFRLQWNEGPEGLATEFTPESVQRALNRRKALLEANPNLILIAEIRYRDAAGNYLPEDHPWWKRDEHGARAKGWEEGGYFLLDFANPEFQAHVAAQARAVVRSGVVDGVMLDWWNDDAVHLQLVRKVREAIGEDALIIVNANDRRTPQTAPYINGYFMECYRSQTPDDWRTIAQTLSWAEMNLRAPHINCVETWYHHSRQDLNLMRATTTMALTLSDGYCLFSDPNPLPTPDHLHDWYSFWNKSLGRPKSAGQRQPDGSIRREFEHGTVVYNPMGNPAVHVEFAEPRRSLATGNLSSEHEIDPADGDIFLLAN